MPTRNENRYLEDDWGSSGENQVAHTRELRNLTVERRIALRLRPRSFITVTAVKAIRVHMESERQ